MIESSKICRQICYAMYCVHRFFKLFLFRRILIENSFKINENNVIEYEPEVPSDSSDDYSNCDEMQQSEDIQSAINDVDNEIWD